MAGKRVGEPVIWLAMNGGIRNLVLIALMQVGVIVGGILGAGVFYKLAAVTHAQLPRPILALVTYGGFGLGLPLIWITTALLIRRRPDVAQEVKQLVHWLGLALLIGLGAFMIYADVTPWLGIMWRMDGDSSE